MHTNKQSPTLSISLPSTRRPLSRQPSSSPYSSALIASKSTPRTRALPQPTYTTGALRQPRPRTRAIPQPTHTTEALPQPKPRTRGLPQFSQGSNTIPKHPSLSVPQPHVHDRILKPKTPLRDSRFQLSANHITVNIPAPLGPHNIMRMQGYQWRHNGISRSADISITFRHFKEDWGDLATPFLLSLKYLEHLYQHLLKKESDYCSKHLISNATPFTLVTPNEPVKGLDLFLYILYRKDLGHIIPDLLKNLHTHLPTYITSYTKAIRRSFSLSSHTMGSSRHLSLSHRINALKMATNHLPIACSTLVPKDPFDRSYVPPAMLGIDHGPTFILMSDFTYMHMHSSEKPPLLKHYYEQLHSDGVDTIIRLNGEYKDQWALFGYTVIASNPYGIRTIDLFSKDGYPVPSDILRHSVRCIRGSSTKKIAIHCKSGLGRTGSIIAHWYKTFHPEIEIGRLLATLRLLRHPFTIFDNQENALFPKSPKR